MPVPARKKSNASVGRHRSHDALKPKVTGLCQSCNAPKLPHRACPTCGIYKNGSR